MRCLSLPVLTHVERDRGWGSAYVTYQLHTQAYIVRCTLNTSHAVHTVRCTPMSVTKCNKHETYMLSSTRHFIFFHYIVDNILHTLYQNTVYILHNPHYILCMAIMGWGGHICHAYITSGLHCCPPCLPDGMSTVQQRCLCTRHCWEGGGC